MGDFIETVNSKFEKLGEWYGCSAPNHGPGMTGQLSIFREVNGAIDVQFEQCLEDGISDIVKSCEDAPGTAAHIVFLSLGGVMAICVITAVVVYYCRRRQSSYTELNEEDAAEVLQFSQ